MIHPTAVIHPKAKVNPTVRVGPYAVIDEGVELGPECVVGPHVYLTGLTHIGARNRFYAGCVIGEAPQDLKYTGEPSGLRIGDDNTFREHATVHRATHSGEETIVGSGNLLMASCHVAHNCCLGSHIIIANGALLAGHVNVGDRVIISGNCLIHQFVRIGTLALMQGGSGISRDLPPYTVARRGNRLGGLNIVGLRRAGFSPDERLELKQLYHLLFRGGRKLDVALAAAREKCSAAPSKVLIEFVASSMRGVCIDTGKTREEEEEQE